jgi:hypothetical protein
MENKKLAMLLQKLEASSETNNQEDVFVSLNDELAKNLKATFGGNGTCNNNTGCSNNGSCSNNSGCQSNGTCNGSCGKGTRIEVLEL